MFGKFIKKVKGAVPKKREASSNKNKIKVPPAKQKTKQDKKIKGEKNNKEILEQLKEDYKRANWGLERGAALFGSAFNISIK